jgi:hypothetical protein
MSKTWSNWSRRQLLRYGGVGAALAIAGCGESSDDTGGDDTTGTGSTGDGDGNSSADGTNRTGGNIPDDPENVFALAGDGAQQYRNWLVPEYSLDAELEAERKQLYQFNDYERAADAGWDAQLEFRNHFADILGADPQSFESEILVGPIDDSTPHRIFFGSFDTETVQATVEERGFERTGKDHEFAVFGDRIAISENVIIEHPSYATFLETKRAARDSLGATDEDVALLLDLVPAAPLVTLSRREEKDDLVVDAMSVLAFDEDEFYSHAVRTLIFEEESDATSDRVRELVVEGSVFEEIVTEEVHGRAAMAEVRR